jgi:hypothetical protein
MHENVKTQSQVMQQQEKKKKNVVIIKSTTLYACRGETLL